MEFTSEIRARVKKKGVRIVLPEGDDERVKKAAEIITREELAEVVMFGRGFAIPQDYSCFDDFVAKLYQMRKENGLNLQEALQLLKDPLYFSAMMVKEGIAHGSVAGAANPTSAVLRPALQIIRTAPGIALVSGAFIMLLNDGMILVFADCAVNPMPDAQELAAIGISSAKTARTIADIEPKVAFLSFSTKGSAEHEMVEKVVEATSIARKKATEYEFDGELQADAALMQDVAGKKAPGSDVAGKANVLVFPDLNAGNIGYKLVQRLAQAKAIGPIIQGLAKPVNDLSRGCSVEDIVNLVAITSLQALNQDEKEGLN